MRKVFPLFLFAVFWVLPAWAQNPPIPITTLTASGSSCVSGSTTAGSFLIVNITPAQGAASFTINANAGSNTISFYASGDGGKTYVTLSVTPSNSTTTVTTTTGTGVWRASVAGYTNVCMLESTKSSGNTLVNIAPSTASALGLGGGGGSGATAFPVTVTGGVSGAVPCFTSTTTESAGTLLAANTLMLGGGAGACPSTNPAWIEDVNFNNSLRSNVNGGIILTPAAANGTGATIFLSTAAAESIMQLGNSFGGGQFTIDASGNLSDNGSVTLTGVTTGTNADFACFAAGKVLTLQATACTISSARFKQNIHPLSMSALSEVMKLKPVTFNRIPDQKNPDVDVNAYVKQIGLVAENVANVDPKAAIYEQDGVTPKSYRQESIIALLVKAVQEQQKEIYELNARMTKR